MKDRRIPPRRHQKYKVAYKVRPKDVPFAVDPPRTHAALVAAAAGESKTDHTGRAPGLGNQYGNAAFRSVFRPFLLSREIIDLTFKRVKKSPLFHRDLMAMCFSKPQSSPASEGSGVVVNVHLGDPKLNIRLGYGPGAGNGHDAPAITVGAKPALPGGNGGNGGTGKS